MRLSVRHTLHWMFEEPATMTVQVLRLAPHDLGGLTILYWRVTTDRGGALPAYDDGYGNRSLLLTRIGTHRSVQVTVDGAVETHDPGGTVQKVEEDLPPLVFLRETTSTAPDAAIHALAAAHPEPEALAEALRARIMLTRDGPSDAAGTLAAGRGSRAGMLHLFLSACRAGGVPARLVSGHVWPGRNGMEAGAPHLWVELWREERGWISLDPLEGFPAGARHLRLAIGLDETEAGPVRGIRRGPGGASFTQAVRVTAAGIPA